MSLHSGRGVLRDIPGVGRIRVGNLGNVGHAAVIGDGQERPVAAPGGGDVRRVHVRRPLVQVSLRR